MDYEYQITDTRYVTPTTLVLTMFARNPRRIMPYKPGQYAAISFRSNGRPTPARCFSIVSSPAEPGWLQFGLRVKGDFTQTAAKHIKVGDTIKVRGPFGGFVVNPFRDRYDVLLAGGIGITPFMSMARAAAAGQLHSDLVLAYSCSDQDDVPFADELMALARSNPFLHLVFVIGKGPTSRFGGWPVLQGRLTPEMLDTILGGAYRGRTYFLCGPPPFMESMIAGLRQRHIPQRRIITEVFSQKVPQSSVLLGRPTQVYALAAASFVIGTAMIFNQDVRAAQGADTTAAEGTASTGAAAGQTPLGTTGGSRQGEVDQQINGLLAGGGGTAGGTVAAGVAEADGGQPASGSGVVSPSAAGATPTPVPPAAPLPPPPPPSPTPVAPTLTFAANATSVTAGTAVTLSWALSNGATGVSCTASGGWSGNKATAGTASVAPAATTTYMLVCANATGSVTRAVTVNVVQPAPTPTPPTPAPTPTPTPSPSTGGS